MIISVKQILLALLKRSNLRVIEVTASSATSVAANGGTAWITVPPPEDCTVIFPIGYYLSGGWNCSVYSIGIDNSNQGKIAIRNNGTAAQTVTATIRYLVMD